MIGNVDAALFAVLVLLCVVGLCTSVWIARRLGRWLNFRSLLLVNFTVVIGFSGIFHLTSSATSAGFFDIRGPSAAEYATKAVFIAAVAMIGLVFALTRNIGHKRGRRKEEDPAVLSTMSVMQRRYLIVVGSVLLPISIFATISLNAFAQTVDTDRIISLEGGLARYSFLSSWFTWGVCFIALAIANSRFGRSRAVVGIVLTTSALLITASLAWNGGRSVVIVMVLPLALVLLPRIRGLRWFLIPAALVSAFNYIVGLTEERIGVTDGFDIGSWVDWQWGRFSMLGWAVQQVESKDYLFGETFGAAYGSLMSGILRLGGIPASGPDMQTSTQLTGASILGDADQTYIVPGLIAELFLSFGFVGVALGMVCLGLITNYVDRKFADAQDDTIRLALAYVGSLLVLRTVSAEAGAFPTYLLYTGLPVVIVGLISVFGGKANRAQRLRR